MRAGVRDHARRSGALRGCGHLYAEPAHSLWRAPVLGRRQHALCRRRRRRHR